MNHAELMRQLADFDKKLAQMDENVSNEITEKVIKEAANKLYNEQKRILSGAPTEGIRRLADDLSVWKDNSRPVLFVFLVEVRIYFKRCFYIGMSCLFFCG